MLVHTMSDTCCNPKPPMRSPASAQWRRAGSSPALGLEYRCTVGWRAVSTRSTHTTHLTSCLIVSSPVHFFSSHSPAWVEASMVVARECSPMVTPFFSARAVSTALLLRRLCSWRAESALLPHPFHSTATVVREDLALDPIVSAPYRAEATPSPWT